MTPPVVESDLAAPATEIRDPSARRTWPTAADLLALAKPRVVIMVLVTTAVGYHFGLIGQPDWARLLHVLVGTMLAAGGTLALNQYWERDIDARMQRTRRRPLPDGRVRPRHALLFGVISTLLGLLWLAARVSGTAAGVTVLISLLYLGVYTPLKRRTPLCTIVGAVPGALPPVTGWIAAREEFGVGAWILFGIVFLWQLPHTLAIARLYRDDYARAGVRLLPVVDVDGTSTERQIVIGSLALLVMSLLPAPLGLAGPVYVVGALLLGVGLVVLGTRQALAPSPQAARRVLWASLVYLPVVLALLALDAS